VEACFGAPANPTAADRLSLLSRARNPDSVKLALGEASRSLLPWECDAFWERAL